MDIEELAGEVKVRVSADLEPLEQGFEEARRRSQAFDEEVSGSFEKAATAARELGAEVKGSAAAAASGMNEVTASAQSFGDKVEGSTASAASSMDSVTSSARAMTDQIQSASNAAAESLNDAAGSAGTLGQQVSNASQAASESLTGATSAARDFGDTLADSTTNAAGSMDTAAQSASHLGDAVSSASSAATEGLENAANSAGKLGDAVGDSAAAAAGGLKDATASARDLGGAAQQSGAAAVQSLDNVTQSAKNVADTVGGATGELDDAMSQLADNLTQMWGTTNEAAEQAAGNIDNVSAATGRLDDSIQQSSANVAAGLDNASQSAIRLGEDVKASTASADDSLMSLGDSLREMWEGATAPIIEQKKTLSDLVSEYRRAQAQSEEFGSSMFDSLDSATRAAVDLGTGVSNATEQATEGLNEAAAAAGGFGGGVGNAAEQAAGGFDRLGRVLLSVGDILRVLITLAASLAAAFLGALTFEKFIQESINFEREQTQLAATLRATGNAAEQSLDALNEHADALVKITSYTGGAISQAQALLLTFTNIRGDVFERATEGILDMSAALNRDLTSSARMVGMALEDPVRGLDSLRRSGVRFSEAQRDMIRELVAAGDVQKAQILILEELEKSYGGVAEAARGTLGGALSALGEALAKAFTIGSQATEPLREAIEDLISAINDPAFQQFMEIIGTALFGALTLAVRGAELLVNAIGAVVNSLDEIGVAVATAGTLLAAYFGPQIFVAIVTGFATMAAAGVKAIAAISGALVANPLGALLVGLTVATTALYIFRDEIKEALGVDLIGVVKDTANYIIGSFRAVWNDLVFIWKNFGDIVESAMVGIVNIVARAFTNLINGIIAKINDLIRVWNETLGKFSSEVEEIVPFDPNAMTVENTAFDRLSEAWRERNEFLQKAMNTDYLGSLVEGVIHAFTEAQKVMNESGNAAAGAIEGSSKLFKLAEQGYQDVAGGLGALSLGANGAASSIDMAAGSMVGSFGKVGAAAHGSAQQLGQFWLDANHVLIDYGMVARQVNTDFILQQQQLQTELRNTERALDHLRVTINEAASAGTIEAFFGDISNISGAQRAIEDGVTTINKLFTALREGRTDAVTLSEGIDMVRQSLLGAGLDELQVNKFINSLVQAQANTDTLANKVKQLDFIIQSMKDKTITIDVVTNYIVPQHDGSGTSNVGVFYQRGQGPTGSILDYNVPSQDGSGTSGVRVHQYGGGGGTSQGEFMNQYRMDSGSTIGVRGYGSSSSLNENTGPTKVADTNDSWFMTTMSGISDSMTKVASSLSAGMGPYGMSAATISGGTVRDTSTQSVMPPEPKADFAGGVTDYMRDDTAKVGFDDVSGNVMKVATQLVGSDDSTRRVIQGGADRTTAGLSTLGADLGVLDDSLSSATRNAADDIVTCIRQLGSSIGYGRFLGQYQKGGGSVDTNLGGLANMASGLGDYAKVHYTGSSILRPIDTSGAIAKLYAEQGLLNNVGTGNFGFGNNNTGGGGKVYRQQMGSGGANALMSMAYMNDIKNSNDSSQTVNNNGDINITVPVQISTATFEGTRTGQTAPNSISPQSIAEIQQGVAAEVINAMRQAQGR